MARFLRWSPCLAILMMLGCSHENPADKLTGMPPGTGFILRDSHGDAGDHKYTVFLPRDYNASRKYPTIVFLHGIGEAGGDGIGCTTVGLGPAIARRNGEFPFIVIFPQTGWDWTSDTSEHIMLDALHDAEKNYPGIDTSRVSLTGMSSGGRGTWVLGARHPEIFSALVPMGGNAAVDEAPRLTHIPIWALHNEDDWVVSVSNTREMMDAIQAAGGHPRATIYPAAGKGHDCWDQAYDEGELFAWLQQQRLMK